MADPSQSKLLYQSPYNTTSFVNLFQPDYDKYPALKKVEALKVTLHHGDTLFIPAGYWHQLKYTDASMSVAFRKWNIHPTTTLKTAIQRVAGLPFDKATSWLLGEKWLTYKTQLAKKRAEFGLS